MTDIATFDVSPQLPVTVRRRRAGVRTSSEDGAILRRQVQSSKSKHSGEAHVRTFGLRWPKGLLQELERVERFADATLGGALTLAWTPPAPEDSDGAISVRFVEGSLRSEDLTALRVRFDFEFEEAI